MLILRWFPCFVFFLAAFKIFSLSLAFNIFRMTCLGMDLFVFILEFNKLLGYVDFLKSLSHYSSNIYLSLYVILMLSSLSSPSGTPIMCMLVCLIAFHISLKACLFSSLCFLSVLQIA